MLTSHQPQLPGAANVPPVDLTWTVDDTLIRHPASAGVFNAFGIDTCCGGGATLREAAAHVHLAPVTLLAELHLAITSAARGAA